MQIAGYGMEEHIANSQAAGFIQNLIQSVRFGDAREITRQTRGKSFAQPNRATGPPNDF